MDPPPPSTVAPPNPSSDGPLSSDDTTSADTPSSAAADTPHAAVDPHPCTNSVDYATAAPLFPSAGDITYPESIAICKT